MPDTLEITGFEHDGVWIEDITQTPCGRATLTPEQSADLYSQSILDGLKKAVKHDCEDWLLLDVVCGFVQDAIGISDGGNAGLYWSGYEDGIEDLIEAHETNNILDVISDDLLLDYIKSEINFHYSGISDVQK